MWMAKQTPQPLTPMCIATGRAKPQVMIAGRMDEVKMAVLEKMEMTKLATVSMMQRMRSEAGSKV